MLAGEFVCVNPHLVEELVTRKLWTKEVQNQIVALNGSVQEIKAIPTEVK